MADLCGPAQLDWQYGRRADLPWPVILPGSWRGSAATGHWAVGELRRLGISIPPCLAGPAAEIAADVYEMGYGDG